MCAESRGRTAGEALMFDGVDPAVFHSSSGGRTESAGEIWSESLPLRAVDVVGEDVSPDTYWRARVSAEALARAVDGAHRRGRGVVSSSGDGHGSFAGGRASRASKARDRVADWCSARSDRGNHTAFEFDSRRAAGFVFVVRGAARRRDEPVGAFAARGARYRDILALLS